MQSFAVGVTNRTFGTGVGLNGHTERGGVPTPTTVQFHWSNELGTKALDTDNGPLPDPVLEALEGAWEAVAGPPYHPTRCSGRQTMTLDQDN